MNRSFVLPRAFRTPLPSAIIVVLIAAVVAINAAAFGAIHTLRWKALPYADAAQLVDVRVQLQKFGFTVGLSEPLRLQLDADSAHFAGVVGFSKIHSVEDGRTWQLARVSTNFSRVLGVSAALGRSFDAEDARPGADATLLLGDTIWRRRFNADPGVIGREVRFGDRDYTVIGVMPPGFAFPDSGTEAWRPYLASPTERALAEQGNVGDLDVLARLAPGVSMEQAYATLANLLAGEPSLAGMRHNVGLQADLRAWRDRFAAGHWQALTLLQLSALLLLLAVAANLVNLQLDQLLGRAREFAIRRALGASEAAIRRGVMWELAPPVLLGLVLGLVLAPALMQLTRTHGLLPPDLPQGIDFGPVIVGGGAVVAAIALFSMLLAVTAASRGMTLGSRSGKGGLGRLRPAMLIGQIMLTTALLGGSGLLLRSALNLVSVDPGFDAHGVLLTAVDPVGVGMRGKAFDADRDGAKFRAGVEAIRADIARLPGVTVAALSTMPPFSGWESVSTIRAWGQTDDAQARQRAVSPGYFAALGIGLVAGREFEHGDGDREDVVVVDERYRERFLAAADPLQSYVELPEHGDEKNYFRARIVGVSRTVRHEALDEANNLPTVYRLSTAPLPIFWLVTRTSGDVAQLAETVRQRIRSTAPNADVGIDKPLEELVSATFADRRALVEALGAFAVATLLLAGLGLSAVLGFAVRRRRGEFGVRLALGAAAWRIELLVLRQGGTLIGLGAAFGLVLGMALARLVADRLYGVGYADATTWGLSALVVVVVAVAALASWLPARRAASVDPAVALRHD